MLRPLSLTSAQSDPDDEPDLPEWARRMCWCQACGLVFTGVGGFDAHRTGEYDRPGTAGTSTRRCLTPDELHEKGFEPNEHGRWGKPSERDA